MYAALSQQPANRPLSRIAVAQPLVASQAPQMHVHPAPMHAVAPPANSQSAHVQQLPAHHQQPAPQQMAPAPVHELGDPSSPPAPQPPQPPQDLPAGSIATELMEISVTQYVLVLLVAAAIGMIGVVVSRVA